MDEEKRRLKALREKANAAIAAQLRAERARRDLTQPQLAALVGVHVNTIVRWESGERSPGADQLIALGLALEVDSGEMLNAAQAAMKRE